MNKEELLNELSRRISAGEISPSEVESRLALRLPDTPHLAEAPHASSISATKVLYVLGVAIAVIGIAIFVGEIWDEIGSFGRIGVTLGLGLFMAAMGSVLLQQKPEQSIGSIFHFMGGVLIPGGALVVLDEARGTITLWSAALTFSAIFVFYMLLVIAHKRAVLTFFAIASATVSLYLLVGAMVQDTSNYPDDLFAYCTMAIGASYLFLAHSFRDGWNSKLCGLLYFFGSLGFLSAAFTLVFGSVTWQLLYFVIVLGGLALSAYMKRRVLLVMSTLFLIVHISYVTGKYFADSIGWPVSLVLLGFIIIGLGYASVSINKKYIKGDVVSSVPVS